MLYTLMLQGSHELTRQRWPYREALVNPVHYTLVIHDRLQPQSPVGIRDAELFAQEF